MRVVVWAGGTFDTSARVGGVETYGRALVEAIASRGAEVLVVDSIDHVTRSESDFGTILGLPADEWKQGSRSAFVREQGVTDDWVHIVLNTNARPRHIGRRSIGVQHGVYWDRAPSARLLQLPIIEPVARRVRMERGARHVGQYSRLVCVDLAFPLFASCFRTLDWTRIRYIPNFAPGPPSPPPVTSDVQRIVFARRLEPHRGTRLFEGLATALLSDSHWKGTIDVIGTGSDEVRLRRTLGRSARVRFITLSFEQRMEAFSADALVLVPSISTEGTSLTAIEAMSRGALVVGTTVGGLGNVIIPNHNGLLVEPTTTALLNVVMAATRGEIDVASLRRNAIQTHRDSFSLGRWADQWAEVLDDV